AFVIAGALSWIGRWYQPGGEYTPEQVAQQCIATLCDGVLRRPAQAAVPEVVPVPAAQRKVGGAKAKAPARSGKA
ncbi:MAG: TetR/AcrR family transcriptional regulator, partial [Acidovorax sp.]|nr:TetR/AcrR family transcriptional regulator [Acidovorax sp.]